METNHGNSPSPATPGSEGNTSPATSGGASLSVDMTQRAPSRFVKRGAVVAATCATDDGETRNGAPVQKGDWVVEHGNDVQEVIRPEAFDQTYQPLSDVIV